MERNLDSEKLLSPCEFKEKIKNNIFFLRRAYGVSLTNGSHSPQEERFCKTLKELEQAYEKTNNKEYLKIKEEAKRKYSELVFNCEKHGSKYGGLN